MDDDFLVNLNKTFGSLENGEKWMKRPCRSLNEQQPIDLIATPEGLVEVLAVLGRIRHGIFS